MHNRPRAVDPFPRVPRSPRVGEPVADKGEALIRAALELFAGENLRSHCGTGDRRQGPRRHGTVYRHFASKEALANTVFRRCKTAMHETMLAAFGSSGNEQQRFLALWRGLAALATSDPTALRFLELQHHEEYLDDTSRRLGDQVFATAERSVKDGQRSGALRTGDAAVVISLVFGALSASSRNPARGASPSTTTPSRTPASRCGA